MREQPSCNASPPLGVCMWFWFRASAVAKGWSLWSALFPFPSAWDLEGKGCSISNTWFFVGINSMRYYSMVCLPLIEQFFWICVCGALYCHNKRDGGGGKEGNTAFRAASWKVKGCLILPQVAIRAFRFTYFASSVSFWWLLHVSEDIEEKKFK